MTHGESTISTSNGQTSPLNCFLTQPRHSLISWVLVNSVYLCNRFRVLDQQIVNFCLGALYSQKHHEALSMCPMGIVELTEAVLPLCGKQFVILNHKTGYNGLKDCLKGVSSKLSRPRGVVTIRLEPGCQLQFCHLPQNGLLSIFCKDQTELTIYLDVDLQLPGYCCITCPRHLHHHLLLHSLPLRRAPTSVTNDSQFWRIFPSSNSVCHTTTTTKINSVYQQHDLKPHHHSVFMKN